MKDNLHGPSWMEPTSKESAHASPSDDEKYDQLGKYTEERLSDAHRAIRQSREIIGLGNISTNDIPIRQVLRGARQDVQGALEHIGEMEKLLPEKEATI